MTDLLISIVNMDNRDLLRACLESLPSACGELRTRVVVVDNASRDGSAEMLSSEFQQVDLVRNDHPHGFGRNHNAVLAPVLDGTLQPAPRYVCFLNDDTLLEPGSLSRLVATMDADPRVGITGPLIVDGAGVEQFTLYRPPTMLTDLKVFLGLPRPAASEASAWLNGSCLVVRTTLLERIGGFDERFFLFAEDVDLCYRATQAGSLIRRVPQARIVHYCHTSVKRPQHGSRMEKQMVRSRYLYDAKHHGRLRARSVLALHRSMLRLRALRNAVRARRGREASRALVTLLRELAAYDPRCPLRFERESMLRPGPRWRPSVRAHSSRPAAPHDGPG